jgi:hypothetical protein
MTETEIVGVRDVSLESGKWLSDDGRTMKLIHVHLQKAEFGIKDAEL